MSTTVTYKGQTLTTVENQTKTLNTAGTWVEGDFTLTDVTQGGGGDEWVRPADFPDLSKMDISGGDIIYMTYRADERFGYCDFYLRCTGKYTVEVGDIVNGAFVSESTHELNTNDNCRLYFGTANGTYKVLKVTGTNITWYENNTGGGLIKYGGHYLMARMQGQLEIYGNLPHCAHFNGRTVYQLQCVELQNLVLTGASNMMFEWCVGLRKVVADTWDMSGCTHLGTAFRYCRNLTKIVGIEDWDVSSVANFDAMFWGCERLETLDLSKWDVSSADRFTNMFNGCYLLKSLDLSGWDTSSAKYMGCMFLECRELKVLKLPAQFVKSSVTDVYRMFAGCWKLEDLDVSDWDVSSIENVHQLFATMYAVKEIDISSWNLSSVTTYTEMFALNQGIKTVTIPASLSTIGNQFFNQAECITEFHMLATTPPVLANAFSSVSWMNGAGGRKIYVPYSADHSVLNAYKTATNWSTYASYIVEEDA